MAPLWGRSNDDRERLLSTVRTLGTTTVQGLAAVMTLSERKVERLLRETVREAPSGLRFNPVVQSVWWEEPANRLPPPPDAIEAPSVAPAAAPPAPPLPSDGARPTRIETLPVPENGNGHRSSASHRCPSCHILLVPTGSSDRLCCPQCGRLTSAPGLSASAPSLVAEVSGGFVPAAASSPESIESADRRTQELLAAWVLGRPIPCPRCRAALHHRGFGQYACPSCGEWVRFAVSGGFGATSVSHGPDAAPAPAPEAPSPRSTPIALSASAADPL